MDEARTGRVRASDAERELVVDRLALAVSRGRMGLTEFDERVSAAYGAVTRAELAELIRDLPGYLW